MAWLIYVHHAGNLSMPQTTKKVRVLEPSLTATLHSSSSLFHLPQSDQMFYLLSMSITLFYLHSARKHCKNMSFTVHMVTRIETQNMCAGLQPCATHSSGIVQPLVGIVTSGPQVCSSRPPKIRKPKKTVPTISITSVTIISKKKWLSAYKVRFIQKSFHKYSAVRPCPPSPVAISPPPLLSCSYSSSQLEPRRDFSVSANRAASRRFSVDRSTHLL